MSKIYFDDYFGKIKYSDGFGKHDNWNKKINKWLEYLYKADKKFYNTGKQRVKQQTKRDPFLAEVFALFYFSSVLGAKNIRIEPNKSSENDIDFSCDCFGGENWKIEVKAPNWRGEIVGNSKKITTEEKARLGEPHYRTEDGGSFSSKDDAFNVIHNSIEKSLGKFNKNENNALVIIPNMLKPLMENIYPCELKQIITEGIEELNQNDLISKVIIIENEEYFCMDFLKEIK
jgi:hypothetical protein